MSESAKPAKADTVAEADNSVVQVSQTGGDVVAPKERSIVDRLKKSGLDPQKLLDLTLPGASGKASTKSRHRLIALGFALVVALPSLAFTFYMFFIAGDQYHSVTAFALRSANQTPATEVLGMVLDSGGGESTSSNSYIVHDYLQSQAIVQDLPENVSLEEIFNRDGADWLFRMGTDLSIEEKVDYWNSKVDVEYDSTSGVIYIETRSFNAEDSLLLAKTILNRSEILVNQLSLENRRQSVKFAEEALARAEARLKAIRKQMIAYRETTQEVDPESNAELAMEMIAKLDQEVVAKEAERATLGDHLDDDSPKIRLLTGEINALKAQMAKERQRLGGGTGRDSISYRIADYSELALEEEFAQKLYTTALAGLEKVESRNDRRLTQQIRTGSKSLFLGFAGWKHDFYRSVFPDKDILFLGGAQYGLPQTIDALFDCMHEQDIYVWSYKDPFWLSALCANNSCSTLRIEDGFLRSVGLGAHRTKPLSIIVERDADLFFHKSRNSSLHRLLRNLDSSGKAKFHEQGTRLKELILADNLSKYNFRRSGETVDISENAVLVLGQVERDESIRRGPVPYITCEQLLEHATTENPGATIYFKPHPEVHSGIAKPFSAPFRRFPHVREFPQSVNMFDYADRFRRVYAISSLAGFEMLLRDVPVTTLGGPWYGGWGLTDDRNIDPEPQTGITPEILLWAAYGEHPLYLRENGQTTDIYSVIQILSEKLRR
ncbi:lpsZ [Symbiodinium sp. KB8]|nr:lpsZ [Symbiodinium sp. KB8]